MDIAGKVVLITGASSGIGKAAAKRFAAHGAKVALAARSADKLAELAATLPDSLAVPTDLLRQEDVARMVAQTHAHYGRIDVLINNAGRSMMQPVASARLDAYRELLELNVVSVLGAMQHVIPIMRAQGGGSIVNISSGTTKYLIPGYAPYSSTKYALNNITEIARGELAPDGIVVSLVFPGLTATNFGYNAVDATPERGAYYAQGESADSVAALIVQAVQTGAPEVLAESVRQRLSP